MKRNVVLLCLVSAAACAQTPPPLPAVPAGRIERWPDHPSRFVVPRNIDIWLPPGYDGTKRCSVLYMQDGQGLFDPSATWNRKAWGMAETLTTLIRAGRIPDTLVVGVWSVSSQRHSEYFPQKALAFLPEPERSQFVAKWLNGKPQGDAYLRFLVQELKPEIDRKFATRADRAHTVIIGSSMGAICSLYALCEYPEVFGGAGCLSTHWIGSFEKNASLPLATFDYLERHVPDPATHRIYFDHGTETLDALYGESQAFADLLFREKGYGDANFMSRVYPGDGHSEDAWARRVAVPVEFLLGH